MKRTFTFYILLFSPLLFAQAQTDAEKCTEHTADLKSYHTRLMDYKSPTSNKKYLDLVREKNSINAALTLTDALNKITEEYYDYLGSVGDANVKKINDLQILLQSQAPAASRMTYAVDMMTALGDDELPSGRVERIQAIAVRLRNSCARNASTSFCHGLRPDFWSTLTSRDSGDDDSHSAMVEQFIHVAAASKDIGTHFVQDTRFDNLMRQDPASNATFTSLLSKAVDDVAKNCANVDLLHITNGPGDDGKCLNINLSELENGDRLLRALGPTQTEVTSLGDVVNNYLERVNKVKNGQLKLTGELVNLYSNASTANFSRADNRLKDYAPVIRANFEKLKGHLAGTLHGAFKLASSNDNLQALLSGANDISLNPSAHEIIDRLNRVTTDLTGLSNDLFKVTPNGKMDFNRETLANALASDQLKPVRLRAMKSELQNRLASIDAELASLNEQEGFSVLERLQNFTWGNVRYFCGDKAIDQERSGEPCSYRAGYGHGLQQLVETSNDINRMERIEQENEEIDGMLEYCNDPQNMASERDTLDRTCSMLIARRNDLNNRSRAERQRLERRERLVSDSTTYPVFNEENEVIGRRPRINWMRQGLSNGFQSGIATLLPVGMNYFHLKGSLLSTVNMAQSRITYNAWSQAQSSFPQNNCYLYMCSPYNYNTSITPTMGYYGF